MNHAERSMVFVVFRRSGALVELTVSCLGPEFLPTWCLILALFTGISDMLLSSGVLLPNHTSPSPGHRDTPRASHTGMHHQQNTTQPSISGSHAAATSQVRLSQPRDTKTRQRHLNITPALYIPWRQPLSPPTLIPSTDIAITGKPLKV